MIKNFPLTGVGLGAWSVVCPKYRNEDVMPGFFEYSLNDYAQMAAEFGAIGFLWLHGIVLVGVVVAILAQAKRSDPLICGLSFASMVSILSIMIHSSVDSNSQILANAIHFMVLLVQGRVALYLNRRPAKAEQVDPGASDALIHLKTGIS
jgi:O-antigen ligase